MTGQEFHDQYRSAIDGIVEAQRAKQEADKNNDNAWRTLEDLSDQVTREGVTPGTPKAAALPQAKK